jgi:hypothetical protein
MAVQQITASNACVWHVHCELACCIDPSQRSELNVSVCVWHPLMSVTCSEPVMLGH